MSFNSCSKCFVILLCAVKWQPCSDTGLLYFKVRKINVLLCEWSVECFENQPAKVLSIYFIIHCYCAEVAIKSAGINAPHGFHHRTCVWTEGSSVPSEPPRAHGRGIHPRDFILFTLLLKQKYQPDFQC